MNAHAIIHLAFVVAWAFLGFEVIRSLLKLSAQSRTIAGVAAATVAIAYFLGATGPLAWNSDGAEPATQTTVATAPLPAAPVHIVTCPANAVVSQRAGMGYIDNVSIGTAPGLAKPEKIDVPAGADIHLNGWVSLKSGPGTTICVIDNGRPSSDASSYGVYRPDVAAATGVPTNSAAGFALTIKPKIGVHIVAVGAVESDGRSIDKMSGSPLTINVH